jgi:lipid II:glycine glycyltransferase (peptidoglycan interpeptide bridge formation enzyme)
MDLKIVHHLNRDHWRDFVDTHPDGNIFQTPELFEVYSRTRGYKPLLWAVTDVQGQIQALHLPVRVTLRNGVLHYLTTRNVNFGSVLANENEEGRKALSLVLEKYNQEVSRAIMFTELRNVRDQGAFQDIFQQHGYHYQPHLNYFLELDRDHYDILQSFSRSTRSHIRKNVREEAVIVKEITEAGMLPLFYELVKMTYSHARIPLADISLFQEAFKILVPKGMARFTIAFVNGIPASAAVTIQYKDVVYGWYNGVNRSFRPHYPNEFIIWEQMKWGSENGYRVFDFGGAGNLNRESGVRDFKLKFRGSLIEFGRNVCVHAPIRMNLAENVYNFGRKLLQLSKS